MSHLYKILRSKDEYSSVPGPAVIVKNVSGGPFEIDEDGRVLSANTVAAIDDSCPMCKAGIESGKLSVIKEVKGSAPKQKQKAEVKEEPKVEVMAEESAPSDIPPTVALAEEDKSVQ